MIRVKMLFLVGIFAVMGFGFSQVVTAEEPLYDYCNVACLRGECSSTKCRCPENALQNQGLNTTCEGYTYSGFCGTSRLCLD